MRTFENSDLCDHDVRIVCLSSAASIAVLLKSVSFEQQLRGLLAFLFAHAAYVLVASTAQFRSINPASGLPAFGAAEDWMWICPDLVLCHSGLVFLRATPLQTLNL
jgi:hypothetical protein